MNFSRSITTTNQPITLNNYTFHYVYTDGSPADKAFPIPENTVIQPQQTLVFWYNTKARHQQSSILFLEVAFLKKESSPLKINFQALSIVEIEQLAIKNKAGQTIVSASYLAGETDNTGKVVQYQYSKTNVEMAKLATLANSNTRNHTNRLKFPQHL